MKNGARRLAGVSGQPIDEVLGALRPQGLPKSRMPTVDPTCRVVCQGPNLPTP